MQNLKDSNADAEDWKKKFENLDKKVKDDEATAAAEKAKVDMLVSGFERLTEKADKQAEEIEKLKTPMIYDYIDGNMPEWTHEGVQFCTAS